jgi:alpha-beta hydrolase superfamily lysophospholipase
MLLTESTTQIEDGADTFTVTLIEAEQPTAVVFFAAGRGGSPLRHMGLLRTLAQNGYTVGAPHFDMLLSTIPTQQDLDTRIRRFKLTMQQYASDKQPMVGIGHSLGCVVLLVLAGARARTYSGDEIVSNNRSNFAGVVLLAPAVDLFRHPAASVGVTAPVYMRTGKKDVIVPHDRVLALMDRVAEKTSVKLGLDEEAGHLSYMDELPPQVDDCQPDRETFLSNLAEDICGFITYGVGLSKFDTAAKTPL